MTPERDGPQGGHEEPDKTRPGSRGFRFILDPGLATPAATLLAALSENGTVPFPGRGQRKWAR